MMNCADGVMKRDRSYKRTALTGYREFATIIRERYAAQICRHYAPRHYVVITFDAMSSAHTTLRAAPLPELRDNYVI